jgi:hypothetical protein
MTQTSKGPEQKLRPQDPPEEGFQLGRMTLSMT